MKQIYLERQKRLADLLRNAGLGAAAFVPGPNFTYLSGLHFHLMERPTLLIITDQAEILGIMPELERLKWSEAFAQANTFYWQDSDGFEDAFVAAASTLGNIAVGVEGLRMRVFEVDALRRHLGQEAVQDAESTLTRQRMCKDADEVAATQHAIAISETALGETLDAIRTGMTEQQILNILKTRMLAGGAESFAFEPLVLAGGKAANPHGTSDSSPLRAGDPLLIDFGACSEGYNADITRTFFCEYVTDEHASIYETVLTANETGRAIAGPTLTAHELDAQVTEVLSSSPYSELIVHKTGHGLGLDIHEAPHIMKGNHVALEPGALITIEPGLYQKDDIGVRIEDDVLIESTGARSLTSFDRKLNIVGN